MFTVNNSYDCMVGSFLLLVHVIRKYGASVRVERRRARPHLHEPNANIFYKSEADVFNSRPVNIKEF